MKMGNWNRRYIPRKKYRYDYQDRLPSPPRTHGTESRHSGSRNVGVPSWEIDYCNSAQVPWYKILASKKYICCYPTVADWDASAGEEALNGAKERYWANINGLPCEKPLPSTDLYIDDIDWNSYIDQELMSDIDSQYFNPDNVDKVDELLDTIKEEVARDESQSDNPWESNLVKVKGNSNDIIKKGWNQWDGSINPWEEKHDQLGDSLKGNAWGGEIEPWGWKLGHNETWQLANVDYTSENNGMQRVDARQDGWGRTENSSWGRHTGGQEKRNWGDRGNNTWESSIPKGGGYSRDRSWGDNGNESWGCKQSEDQNGYRDFRRSRGGRALYGGGYRKRESSPQHTRYKSSRYEGVNTREWQKRNI